MAAWKMILLATKARRGWKRLPPEQREKLVEGVRRSVKKQGPIVAKRVGAAIRQARKAR
jgi:hypothetical protein